MTHKVEPDIGHQYALAMLDGGEAKVRSVAQEAGSQLTMDAFLRVHNEEPTPAFLHSALCAMSLPIKRPKDETQPIIREDGKYALAINPRPVLQTIDGKPELISLGVPFGALPRVALIYLLSEAVQKQTRDVYLGKNFTEWMRRLGYKTVSYGPRGTATLMKEQVDRLLACEWQIRWEGSDADESAFAVKDVKLSNEYAGSLNKDGAFSREIRMSESFYDHLVEHAVPLNEKAIREIKSTPTALDLYAYLAYRLPRIDGDRPLMLTWAQLAKHLGNGGDRKDFRETVRKAAAQVSSVYPNANFDLGSRIVLRASPAPMEKKLIGSHLRLVGASKDLKAAGRSSVPKLATPKTDEPEANLLPFPSGYFGFSARDQVFRDIALDKGQPWSVDNMAEAFRKGFPDIDRPRTDKEWLRVWEAFVIKYAARRSVSDIE